MELERQNPSAAHWSRDHYKNILDPEGDQVSGRFAWVIEDDSEIEADINHSATSRVVAFLVAQQVHFEWTLENIVVAAKARRQGVGAKLIAELIAFVHRQQGNSIFLEVRASNEGARALYQKLGFIETGTRKNYYADPAGDATLYRLNLS